jgi:hypothetical protein
MDMKMPNLKIGIKPRKIGISDGVKDIGSSGSADKTVSREIEDLNTAVRKAKRSLRDGPWQT